MFWAVGYLEAEVSPCATRVGRGDLLKVDPHLPLLLLGRRLLLLPSVLDVDTLAGGQVAGQPLDVPISGGDTKDTVAQLARDGRLVAIDAGPLHRARQLEGLGFLGMTLQQPLESNFRSAWKLVS
jgi:8-hydroxy-5-deazaflavin:NADPH oxidoreductase